MIPMPQILAGCKATWPARISSTGPFPDSLQHEVSKKTKPETAAVAGSWTWGHLAHWELEVRPFAGHQVLPELASSTASTSPLSRA